MTIAIMRCSAFTVIMFFTPFTAQAGTPKYKSKAPSPVIIPPSNMSDDDEAPKNDRLIQQSLIMKAQTAANQKKPNAYIKPKPISDDENFLLEFLRDHNRIPATE